MLGLNTFDFIKEFASLELFCGLSRVRGRFVADWFRVSLDLSRLILDLVQFHLISFGLVQDCSGYTLVQDVVQIPSRFICLTCVENVETFARKIIGMGPKFLDGKFEFQKRI